MARGGDAQPQVTPDLQFRGPLMPGRGGCGVHTPLRHPHLGEEASHRGLAAHEEQVQEERCHGSGNLRRGPVERLSQEAAAGRRGRRGASAGHGPTRSPAGRVKPGCGITNSLAAKPPGLPWSCWVGPGTGEVAAAPGLPFAGESRPHGPRAAIVGLDEPLQEGPVPRGTTHQPPRSGLRQHSWHPPWDTTLLGALRREGTVTPMT